LTEPARSVDDDDGKEQTEKMKEVYLLGTAQGLTRERERGTVKMNK